MTEETLFHLALQQPEGPERAAFLDGACVGQPELRARLEKLLQAHTQPAAILQKPPAAGEATSDDIPGRLIDPASLQFESGRLLNEGPGSRIGPYKLLQLLGEGGMGAVYMAEQEEPVKRRVALKIIKAGMDSARIIARFEAERQALAMMDHPNIAKVLDAGTTDGGRPYFVMELVKGIPITKFCDHEHLSPKERLELFIPVTQAVQHAHQKGIIHRDIKPSNVLIALYDGKPVPKVIDFGVAKATAQKLTERTMFTEVGQIVGTLEYMAPEQAELNNLDIDTRADIYSLGVLVYELLTGSTPFSAKQLRSAAFDEMLRIIREVEPPRPSTKLSGSEELPAIAANRKLEPAKLARLVRGDLDWIVMKCLEKERARRYETANGLAMDLQRYLVDEPVLAGPPSARYRLSKFLRRNRRGVMAASIVFLALFVGLGGTIWGLFEARRQRDRALSAEAIALEQEGLAKANFELARNAVAEYGTKVSNDPRLKEKDLEALRKELLQSAAKFHQEFLAQHVNDPVLRADLGRAYLDLASLIRDKDNAARALEVSRQAVTTCEKLVEEDPEEASSLLLLAKSLDSLGKMLDETAQPIEARTVFNRAYEMFEGNRRLLGKSVETRRAYLTTCLHYSFLLSDKAGAQSECLDIFRKAAAHLEGNELTASEEPEDKLAEVDLYASLAELLSRGSQKDEAARNCAKAVGILNHIRETSNLPSQVLYHLASIYVTIGRAYYSLNEKSKALEEFHKGVAIYEKLAGLHPGVSVYQHALGKEYNSLAMALDGTGKRSEAVTFFKKALQVKENLAARHPDDPDFKASLARGLGNLSTVTNDLRVARELQSRQQTLLQELNVSFPKVGQYQAALAHSYFQLATLHSKANALADALIAIDQAIQVLEELVHSTDVDHYRQELGRCYGMKCDICLRLNQPQQAAEAFRAVVKLNASDAAALYSLGTALLNHGQLDYAAQALRKSISIYPNSAMAHCNLGHCLMRQGEYVEGRAELQLGHELGSKQSNWNFPSELWVRNAENWIQLDGRLPGILEGKDKPADVGEKLSLAFMCQQHKHLYAAAVRFFTEAFAEQANLEEDLINQHRYNAACAAALASCGQGQDADKLDASKRAELRKQAIAWLAADLAAWTKLADQPKEHGRIRTILQHWQKDTDLVGIRDAKEVAKLPPEEQEAWKKMWSDVAELLKKVEEKR
jgi:serine/threonine protein kinase